MWWGFFHRMSPNSQMSCSGISLQWHHNECDGISNHWRLDLFTQPFVQAEIKEDIRAPRHWPLWGNSPVTSEFPSQRVSNAEKVFTWWHRMETRAGENAYSIIRVFIDFFTCYNLILMWKLTKCLLISLGLFCGYRETAGCSNTRTVSMALF